MVENRVGGFIKDAALAGGAAAVALPFADIGNTTRVITALRGGRIDSVSVPDLERCTSKFGAIVVPGAGSKVIAEGVFVPNTHGRIRFDAAAIAYARGYAPKIIILHGEGHRNIPPSNKDYLQEAFTRYTGGNNIPESAIVDETTTRNTAEDMEQLAKLRREYAGKRVLIITSEFHTNRSALLARAYEVPAKTISAESIVLSEEPEREQEFHDIYGTPEMQYLRRKEAIEIAGSIWDHKAKAWTALRIVDNERRRFTYKLKAG
jgi:uncharacterized SAM-binding protein YcdF (DUF218 family)